jgi:hypothetical protein
MTIVASNIVSWDEISAPPAAERPSKKRLRPNIATWDEIAVPPNPELRRSEGIATEPRSHVASAWEACINSLLPLRMNPAIVNDDTVASPDPAAIEVAIRWLNFLQKRQPDAPPTLIAPEPAGGIIIERRVFTEDGNDVITEFTIYNGGKAEYTMYRNGRILEMMDIPVSPPGGENRSDLGLL